MPVAAYSSDSGGAGDEEGKFCEEEEGDFLERSRALASVGAGGCAAPAAWALSLEEILSST
jgi:hypothetical protein